MELGYLKCLMAESLDPRFTGKRFFFLFSVYGDISCWIFVFDISKSESHAGQEPRPRGTKTVGICSYKKKKNTLRILTINLSSDASRDLLINVPVFSVFSERISKDCQKKKQKNKRKICTS